MFEYTFRFGPAMEAIFTAETEEQAFSIAQKYLQEILDNRGTIELVHTKELNIWD